MSDHERFGSGAREQFAATLAVRGGRLALEAFHAIRDPAGRDDAVSEAAALITDRLAAEIAGAYPGDALLGAEASSAHTHPRALYSWAVGPVDGFVDFGRGLPGFSISIGVLREGLPFAGAVYDPVARWLFTAATGRGAWLNDRALHVGPSSLSCRSLAAIGSPLEAGVPPVVEEWLRRYRLRRIGSTALHLCYVALGALDLVYDHRTSLREVAAAAVTVFEAGGVVTLADGLPLFPPTPAQLGGGRLAVLAGNPASHGQALADTVVVPAAASIEAAAPKINSAVIAS